MKTTFFLFLLVSSNCMALMSQEDIAESLKKRVLITTISDAFFEELLKDAIISNELAYDCLNSALKNKVFSESCSNAAAYYYVTVRSKLDIINQSAHSLSPHQASLYEKAVNINIRSKGYMREVEGLLK